MATRRNSTDDPLAPLTLAVGQEDLLLDRAVQQVVAAATARPTPIRTSGTSPPTSSSPAPLPS